MSNPWDDLWKKPDPPAPVPVNGTGEATSYAAAALRSECAKVAATPEGSRNPTLNEAAFRMGRHVGAGNIDAAVVRVALRDAGLATGLPAHEVDTVLRDNENGAISQGAAHPRHPAPREPVPEPTVLTDPDTGEPETTAEMVRRLFPILDWHELWTREDEDDEWIIEPLLPARRLVALFSAPKIGKSLLMLEVAVGVARGTEVLGVTPTRAHRVLYVDFENDPSGDVRERLRAMRVEPKELDNLCYLSFPTLAKLDTPTGAAELMAVVAEYRCEVVVIDTISRAVGGEENENDTWLSFYRNTGLALKQAEVACIRLDHTGKDHEKGMRGGSAKYGDVDTVWKLSKVTEDTYRLDCTDHRMRVTEDTIVLRRETVPKLTHTVQAEGRLAAFNAKVTEVVAALDAADLPRDVGRDGARAHLKHIGLTVGTDTLREAVNQRKRRFGYAPQEELE